MLVFAYKIQLRFPESHNDESHLVCKEFLEVRR